MAATSATIVVGTTPVALNTAGPTRMVIRNLGQKLILLGVAGAGNQHLPLYPREMIKADIGGSDVLYAVGLENTNVAVLAS